VYPAVAQTPRECSSAVRHRRRRFLVGEGHRAASLGAILEARGLKIAMVKLDPYINVDPGTMSPFQHGEVFVTDRRHETDLDLGHYERFVRTTTAAQQFHHRRIYERVIAQGAARRLPRRHGAGHSAHHRRDQAQHPLRRRGRRRRAWSRSAARSATSSRCPSSRRSARSGSSSAATTPAYMHLTLVPYIATAGEIKTKPTQHSVKELRGSASSPTCCCAAARPLPEEQRRKIALFTNVEERAVISAMDADDIYKIPMLLHEQGLDDIVVDKLHRGAAGRPHRMALARRRRAKATRTARSTSRWSASTCRPRDSYISLNEALIHGGIKTPHAGQHALHRIHRHREQGVHDA
jgi:CTP synthase